MKISGKKRQGRSVLACGLLGIPRNLGTGERIGVDILSHILVGFWFAFFGFSGQECLTT